MYPPVHGDAYRPYSGGQGYRDSHSSTRSDSYRPQYDDNTRRSPHSGDKSNTDAYYPRRQASYYDHDDARSSTSIASTPPRRVIDSPPPDPHPTDRDPSRRSLSCRRTSPARSKTSSTPSESSRKRRRSRCSSRSSVSFRADKCAISAHNHLVNTVSTSSVQQVVVDGFSRNRDQLAFVRSSTPNAYLKPTSLLHELPHVDAKPVHPVMNGELNSLNYPCSPPSLLSGEGTIIIFSRRYP